MALTAPLIYQELAAARAVGGFPLVGPKFDQLAQGVAFAIVTWAVGQPQNVALKGIATGSTGSGTIALPTSRIVMPPSVPVMSAGFRAAGFFGPLGTAVAPVLAVGLANAFTKYAQYTGPVIGVGVGQDASKVVVANAGTLQSLLLSFCASMLGGGGPLNALFATGLAIGTSNMLVASAVGTGSVIGAPGPSPGSGTSQCVMV